MTVPVLREVQISLPIDNQSDIPNRPNTSNLRKENNFSTQNLIYFSLARKHYTEGQDMEWIGNRKETKQNINLKDSGNVYF